ncbi:MAG: hypothetical protein A2268_03665 [Candidatus Raymondbacteria bacterium RifOxyA12_full_50_37]|uniref:EamA domain-containing protein n=1 Tax=Candidatus Raymondbacteria bacterium RIFOXYD12_FULL_49_13 TaxID=1817890 RepID=A0A1F7F4S4_UNCRA|nr:MAG: hypothetical protein A2268_03665 [Candidatus Raymondbacteria bacterium RifOxyA12_full_50_37]OGJ91891.1 MAG: hypothetical protein A2248_04735 [Candidatus Raymondbacteria bacterium RIFOXYA2_FULL_49_16]OGJ91932.1 MAG: hypothetical protein A2350_10320 [Candidatus Raymondbacteria bacterium RifOxyB12_full_50_8]OGJ98071.1 MAG: hypothetical protein A2453_12285 [Candidatus Raymondbacteria bacterium RIFOXYC2_FULL_50_21]OGK01660.1 MAG: hypothetical protein A2519_09015 [Candidatus Raymondbacteria b
MLLAAFPGLLWGTAFPAIKIGLRYADPFFFAAIRFMLAGLLLIALAGPIKEYCATLAREARTIIFVSLFQTVGLYGLFFWGMAYSTGVQGAIITGSGPVMAAVFAHFLVQGDQLNRTKALSIVCLEVPGAGVGRTAQLGLVTR